MNQMMAEESRNFTPRLGLMRTSFEILVKDQLLEYVDCEGFCSALDHVSSVPSPRGFDGRARST